MLMRNPVEAERDSAANPITIPGTGEATAASRQDAIGKIDSADGNAEASFYRLPRNAKSRVSTPFRIHTKGFASTPTLPTMASKFRLL